MTVRLTLIATVILLLAGCAAPQPDTPGSRWLAGKPCAPPCWEEITPGESIISEAIPLLQENPLIDPDSLEIVVADESLGLVTFSFAGDEDEADGSLFIDSASGTVIATRIQLNTICLEDIIEAYGEPDSILITTLLLTDQLDLFWVDAGFTFVAPMEPDSHTVHGGICGGAILHFPPGTNYYDIPGSADVLNAGGLLNPQSFVPWDGYGEY